MKIQIRIGLKTMPIHITWNTHLLLVLGDARKITNLHLVRIVSFVVGELLQQAVNCLHLSKHQPEQQASIITSVKLGNNLNM
jgi:hypothetical protein